MNRATEIIIEAGRNLMKAFYEAPQSHKGQVSELMWECMRVAAIIEGKSLDEFHAELLAALPEPAIDTAGDD